MRRSRMSRGGSCCVDDGWIDIDANAPQRALRGVALGRVERIKPLHARSYLDKRGHTAKARASRERAPLSHAINKARE